MVKKSHILYILFSLLSLISSLVVILFGFQFIENKNIYVLHLQALAVLSSSSLLDYLFINRLELATARHPKIIKKILSKNLLSILVIPLVVLIFFWGNIFVFFLCIVFIKHLFNLRRAVDIISNNYKLSYLSYTGQMIRNSIVFIPMLSTNLYLLGFILSFSFESIYHTIRTKVYKKNIKLSFKFKLIKNDSFIYRFLYILSDIIIRVILPTFLAESDAGVFVFLINLLLLPVAGYSLFGGIVHAYIIKKKNLPKFKVLLTFLLLSTTFIFLLFYIIDIKLDPYVLVFFSLVSSLKFIDQVLISFQVSLMNFKTLKYIFLIGLFFTMLSLFFISEKYPPLVFSLLCMTAPSFFEKYPPLVFALISMTVPSFLLIIFSYIKVPFKERK